MVVYTFNLRTRLNQEDLQFQANLSYIMRPCLRNQADKMIYQVKALPVQAGRPV